jgi:hypothetical protein
MAYEHTKHYSPDQIIPTPEFGKPTGGYGSRELMNTFIKDGIFPKIHNAMASAMVDYFKGNMTNALDIGCSTGLLSLRTHIECGAPNVLGMDPHDPDVQLFGRYLRRETLPVQTVTHTLDIASAKSVQEFQQVVRHHNIKTLVARRVISELVVRYGNKEAGVTHQANAHVIPDAANLFSNALKEAGIEYVVLQGRAYSKRSVHPVPHTSAEMEFLLPRYKQVYSKGPVAIVKVR